jgi:hypothetical protein
MTAEASRSSPSSEVDDAFFAVLAILGDLGVFTGIKKFIGSFCV